ncbi:MAG TPA: Fe-S-containing protein [Candidatus Acidoferrales bacterium]|nr:Fe-S-containing protein [Candidatus Acidoferrales bacterium]
MRFSKFKLLSALALTVGAALLIFSASSTCTSVAGSGIVSVDVSALARGSARMFCYNDDAGKKLRFVLARGADGKVRSVFDACRQCFTFHRGYQVAGGELICRVCGNHYRIDRMTEGKASCVPASLPHEDASGAVKIKTADLRSGAALF